MEELQAGQRLHGVTHLNLSFVIPPPNNRMTPRLTADPGSFAWQKAEAVAAEMTAGTRPTWHWPPCKFLPPKTCNRPGVRRPSASQTKSPQPTSACHLSKARLRFLTTQTAFRGFLARKRNRAAFGLRERRREGCLRQAYLFRGCVSFAASTSVNHCSDKDDHAVRQARERERKGEAQGEWRGEGETRNQKGFEVIHPRSGENSDCKKIS